MKNKKKFLLSLLLASCIAFSATGFAACQNNADNNRDPQIEAIYALYVAAAEAEGTAPLSYADWLQTVKGEKGEKGENGNNGTDGKDGEDGLSAYEIAVKNGYTGTEAEWIASLKGDKGENGTDGNNGTDGKDGEDGLSAYEIAVKNGYTGTEAEWIASLKGDKGENGENGQNAVGIATAYVNQNVHLILVLTNGQEIDAGYVGVSVESDEKTFAVIFRNYDGSVIAVQRIKEGETATIPENPARKDYVFNGWYTDADCTESYSFSQPVTSEINLYAGWKSSTLVMEAEYVDLSGKTGLGFSGSVGGTDMIIQDQSGTLNASNGYYVSYLYQYNQNLTFDFNADSQATDAEIIIRISAEFFDQTFSSENYSVELNGVPLSYAAVSIKGTENPAFIDVTIGTNLVLNKGENKIELITNNNQSFSSGIMAASAPIVDCVKVKSSVNLTWKPLTSNIA